MESKIIFQTTFTKYNFPKWACPVCSKGLLKIESQKIFSDETVTSKSYRNEDYWIPEFAKLVFNGTLKCSSCGGFIFRTLK